MASTVFDHAPLLKGERRTAHHVSPSQGLQYQQSHDTTTCLAARLANELQQGKSLKAWLARARIGINLGISPTHARSVTLVLSLKTGLALPQFHTKHDDLFETVTHKVADF
jgi:hypothetical protein